MNAIVFDIEIAKAIPDRREPIVEGIEYCKGWGDHAGMGISTIGVLDLLANRPRVFFKDNFDDFKKLCGERELHVSFNGIGFDNKVISACLGLELPEEKQYDLLQEVWVASGLSPTFQFGTHGGYGLDAVCEANFGLKKSGNGALAPIWFQRREYGKLVDYCMNDVALTNLLLQLVLDGGGIKCPKTGRMLFLKHPCKPKPTEAEVLETAGAS